jgi:hypothetical protein
MAYLDVSKSWVILAPPRLSAAKTGAGDLVRSIERLRQQAGLSLPAPGIADASENAPDESTPIIVLNSEAKGREWNGFTWRAGEERIEIYGESERGLLNGIYDFLSALEISWPKPGQENLPPVKAGEEGRYPLKEQSAYHPSVNSSKPLENGISPAGRRRIILTGKEGKRGKELIAWAARNKVDALVLPLTGWGPGLSRLARKELRSLAEQYALIIEAGGRNLSLLIPRRYFFLRRELFRMESGRRKWRHNFCPTNHKTIDLLQTEAARRFRSIPGVEVFHLWPEKNREKTWCSCPSCRAFSPVEQNRIAVNAAADALKNLNPRFFLSYYEAPGEEGSIVMRRNTFALERLPGEEGAENFLEIPR